MANIKSIYGNPVVDDSLRQSVAAEYSSYSTYAVGALVLHEGQLYECNTAISTAEAWTAAHWTSKTVAAEVTALKSDITNIQNATLITDTASGAIASFPDGADSVPVKDLSVAIEPVQDLHGQSNPYPAGGGKNLLLPYVRSASADGVTYSVASDGKITLKGTATGNNSFTIWTNASGMTVNETASYTVSMYGALNAKINGANTATQSVTEGNVPSGFAVTIADGTTYDESFYVQIEKGTSATSYAPYENICPISGHTQAKVTRCGKNLLDPSGFVAGKYIRADGTIWSGDTNCATENFIKLEANYTYKISCKSSMSNIGICIYKEDKSTVLSRKNNANVSSVTISSNSSVSYVRFWFDIDGTAMTNERLLAQQPQLELGSTATAYEPYAGQQYTIDLNGTRYGGTLDVTTGVLKVTHGTKVFDGSETWTIEQTDNFFTDVISDSQRTSHVQCSICPSIYASYSAGLLNCWISGSGRFNITIPTIEHTVTAIKSFLSNTPATIVYKLATPFTVQLTAQEITTLLGQNNIWSDCGDSTVEYCADTKLYIQKVINS